MGIPRIKEIRRKEENGYYSLPIGTESYLVDMLSGINLLEENKIGNNHYTEIEETSNATIITLWYCKKSILNIILLEGLITSIKDLIEDIKTGEHNSYIAYVLYKVITTIEEDSSNTYINIILQLSYDTRAQSNPWIFKNIRSKTILIEEENENTSISEILTSSGLEDELEGNGV